MKCPPFGYYSATSADEAVSLLSELGSDAKVLAGGQSLIPLLALRLSRPSHLVDVNPITELSFLDCSSELSIGALTRHRAVETAPGLNSAPWQAFGEAARFVGHLPIRTRGTFGGSLAHGDPSAEFPLLAVTLDAEVRVRSTKATRSIQAAQFFTGFLTTALEADELVVDMRVGAPPPGAVTAFEEFAERAGDFAIAAICCGVALGEKGECTWARVGVGGVGPVPLRVGAAEECLLGSELSSSAIAEASDAVATSLEPTSDARADALFRRELMSELTSRALVRLRKQLEEHPSAVS
ncbi:MAG: FAD binding domain-containing protein [Acidimicrobiales bacterium]